MLRVHVQSVELCCWRAALGLAAPRLWVLRSANSEAGGAEKGAGSHRVPKIIMLTKPAEILKKKNLCLFDEVDCASCVWERTLHCYIGQIFGTN